MTWSPLFPRAFCLDDVDGVSVNRDSKHYSEKYDPIEAQILSFLEY